MSDRRWARRLVEEILAPFDVSIDGQRLWDIRVLDDAFHPRALLAGTL